MAQNLKKLQKTKVSKDLRNKYVLIYGQSKIGKTTLATKFPKNLLFAFEHGYNAIDDIYAVDIPTWGEFKKYVNQLDDDELRSEFNTLTFDTAAIAYDLCEKYICDVNDVSKISEIPFGAGYKMVDSEYADVFRSITQLGYGMVFIAHEKTRVEGDDKKAVKHITPDLNDRCFKILNRLVDLTVYIGLEKDGKRYLYPRQTTISEGFQDVEIYAGSHFAALNDKMELSYENLVNAVATAMTVSDEGKEIKLTDAPVSVMETVTFNFDQIKGDIVAIGKKLSALDDESGSNHMSEFKSITETYLGKGRKIKDCTSSQAEAMSLVLDDLKEYCSKNNL